MRFTANSIDEEISNISSVEECSVHLNPLQLSEVQRCTVSQLTEKLENIHLSDHPSDLTQDCIWDEIIKGATDYQRLAYLKALKNIVRELEASTSRPMEETSTSTDMDLRSGIVPLWLEQYLLNMKQQIKKDVLDELSQSFPGGAQEVKQPPAKWEEIQDNVVHTGIFCDNCDQLIHGIRYKCGKCPDFDLCQECESLPQIHNKSHIFLKIRVPLAVRDKLQELLPQMGSKGRNRDGKKLYEAKFIKDETVPDGTVLPPNLEFVKSWRIVNNGIRVWTHATKLQFIQGSQDFYPRCERVDVPHLKPGEEGVISVVFTTPLRPGVHRSHWNFCHKNRPFGNIVWCQIVVSPTMEWPPAGEPIDPRMVPPKQQDEKKDEEAAAQIAELLTEEHKKGLLGPRKRALSSQTATPNNTPFDLTPPKSPDHQTAAMKPLDTLEKLGSEEEEDSDIEFVVIPMPKCFDLSESLLPQDLIMQHSGVVRVSQETGVPDPPPPQEEESSSSSEISILNDSPIQEEESILDNATFPKFPLADVTSAYDPTPSSKERSVQVLPEGLVNGALSAAASVYNTAKAVMSTMQQTPNRKETSPMEQLIEMGFSHREQNERLLLKHDNDVAMVVAELVGLNDNDWYTSRHVTSSPDRK